MKRPFYVHTPCNRYGESLVGWNNSVKYAARSVFTEKTDHFESLSFDEVKAKAEALNDEFETSQAFAAHI